jgi:serine protease Do
VATAEAARPGVPGLEGALGAVADRLRVVTVHVQTPGGRGAGAGVIWSRGGLVVTNAHVVTGGGTEVVLPDGRSLRARLVGRDPGRDLAALVVQGDADGLPPALRTDARGLRAGELLVAVGHPLGVAYAVALGVVHRPPAAERGSGSWLQADIRLAPGNSGGPLADADGRVVGINAMIVGGLGIAVPTHVIERFVDEVERDRGAGGVRAA